MKFNDDNYVKSENAGSSGPDRRTGRITKNIARQDKFEIQKLKISNLLH